MSPAERQWAIEHLQQCREPFSEIQTDQLREVFPAIFHSNFDRVWDQLRRRGLAEAEARDLFQDTFLTAFLKIVQFGFPENLATYIYTIAKHRILTHVRNRQVALAAVSVGLPSFGSEKPESSTPRWRERAMIYREMAEKLAPEQRAVFEAVEIFGLTHQEAADLLGISEGTVKSRLRIAKRKMWEMAGEVLPPSDRSDQ